jgi:Ca2+/Na+ antiporter
MDHIENEKIVGPTRAHRQQDAVISFDVSFCIASVVFKSFVIVFVNRLTILEMVSFILYFPVLFISFKLSRLECSKCL